MLQFSCQPALKETEAIEMIIASFWEGPRDATDLSRWKKGLSGPLESGDFKGKAFETALVYDSGRIVLLGLGKKEAVTHEILRRAYASAVRFAQTKKGKTIHLLVPQIAHLSQEDTVRSIAEGVLLANYAYRCLKHDSLNDQPIEMVERLILVGVESKFQPMIDQLSTIAAGVYWTRDLVNGNADDITPKMVADSALASAKEVSGLKVTVLEKKDIEQEKMGLLLAVNRGSALDPYLVEMSYQGNPSSSQHIVLVGKGITYDTGGLSLKPTENMLIQKADMSGAATVLAAVRTAAAMNLKVNVTAVAPLTENAIDARSYKNGDVYHSMSGKTVEVASTDAEGRLVLADAITYSIKHLHPSFIIDLASLTGGVVVALGEDIAGLFSNNDNLAHQLLNASAVTGEQIWRMPLNADYKDLLKSEIADLLNAGGRLASSITGALFLQEFCGSIPWAHIDIAGTCFPSKPKYYNPTRATGFGVRLLIEFLKSS